ncbi:mitochondrial carrier domain-containing protein [Mycena crocata]|nr:mitochondrial carrier domain-containing protein [Mycena crocata]
MVDLILFPLSVIFAISAMILPMSIIFGITMPFVGVLVRYRANYAPKRGPQLPTDDGLDHGADTPMSYFGMMKRVHRIEGWRGLYKGVMPSIISSLIVVVAISPLAVFLALGHKVLPNGRMYIGPQSGIVMWIISFALSIVPVLLIIPMQIITNRAITTPHKLDWFSPSAALRALLSADERAKPLRLYFTPGVALSEILQGLVVPTINLLRQLVIPRLYLSHRLPVLIAALPIILLATALLTPLQVMDTRLTLQRLNAAPVEAPVADAPPAYEEEVMEFRTQEAPYEGLIDCGRKMVAEEGWRVLFRAWWLTAFLMVLPLLAPVTA